MAQDTPQKAKADIVPTDSWLNVKGPAVYVNIPESDIRLTENGKYGKRLVFITSIDALKGLVDGKKKGTNLGRFPD